MQNKTHKFTAYVAGATALAMPLAGCGKKPPPTTNTWATTVQTQRSAYNADNDKQNLYTILKKYDFMDEDGFKVDKETLKKELASQFTSLHFGFAECSAFCPRTKNLMDIVRKNVPNVTTVVISVNPEVDGAEGNRKNMRAKLAPGEEENPGLKQKIKILYPIDAAGYPSNRIAPAIESEVVPSALVSPDTPLAHITHVTLHAPNGERLDQQDGAKEEVTGETLSGDWNKKINEYNKGQGISP